MGVQFTQALGFRVVRMLVPNGSTEFAKVLLGETREEPEQVRESDTSSTRTPRDPLLIAPHAL